jgi:hypothetical protein
MNCLGKSVPKKATADTGSPVLPDRKPQTACRGIIQSEQKKSDSLEAPLRFYHDAQRHQTAPKPATHCRTGGCRSWCSISATVSSTRALYHQTLICPHTDVGLSRRPQLPAASHPQSSDTPAISRITVAQPAAHRKRRQHVLR